MNNEQLCRGKTNGEPCVCGLTNAELKEAGVGIFDDCPKCNHALAFHPAGLQGKSDALIVNSTSLL